MSKTLEKLLRRRCYPVKIGTGDDAPTVYIRALTLGEGAAVGNLDDEARVYWTIGTALTEPDGSAAFPVEANEAPADYAKRMTGVLADLPNDTLAELMGAIIKLAKTPSQASLEKN